MRTQGRPPRNVNVLPLRGGMILQQGLTMLPARQTTHPLPDLRAHHIHETIATGVSKDRALHMRRLQLSTMHQQLAVGVDDSLRDVDTVVVVLSEKPSATTMLFSLAQD